MNEMEWMRVIRIAAAIVCLICAAVVARGPSNNRDTNLVSTVGAYIVALAMVGVGYKLAMNAVIFWGY